nr:hypothetical protein [Tanacetum cinerariifolium]
MSALQIADVFGSGYTFALQISNVFGSGYTFALHIANVFDSGYTFALQIADVFGSALVCMHLFGLLRIQTSSSTESALWDAPLCVYFSTFVYFMFDKLPMFTDVTLYRATTPTEPTDIERTKAEQLKIVLKRSRQEMYISQQRGSSIDEGTGSKPGVPDVPSDDSEEELSWNSSDDEDVDEQTKGREESEGDKTDESDDDDDDQDEAEKVNDNDDNEEEVPKIDKQETTESDEGDNEVTESDRESEDEETMEQEEESFDPIPRTSEESKDDDNNEEDLAAAGRRPPPRPPPENFSGGIFPAKPKRLLVSRSPTPRAATVSIATTTAATQPAHHYTTTTFHSTPLTLPPPLPLYSNNTITTATPHRDYAKPPSPLVSPAANATTSTRQPPPQPKKGVCLADNCTKRECLFGLPRQAGNVGRCLFSAAETAAIRGVFVWAAEAGSQRGVVRWLLLPPKPPPYGGVRQYCCRHSRTMAVPARGGFQLVGGLQQ